MAVEQQRPGTTALLIAQLRYSTLTLWRVRMVLVLSFALPLVWLLVVGAIAGNETISSEHGVRVMQLATPVAILMGILYASYPATAITLAEARQSGILKRLRGTPLPAWIFLAGRIGAVMLFALASMAVCLLAGVLAFEVQIVWRTAPATVVTLVLGIACFAALGLAVAALSPSQSAAVGAAIASAVALTFVSGLFTFGDALPAWMNTVGDIFPLKPLNELLQAQFNPFLSGTGWEWRRLAVIAVWTSGAVVVAARFFRWDPRSRTGRTSRRATSEQGAVPSVWHTQPMTVPAVLRIIERPAPSALALVLGQARAANRAAWRDPGSIFFALVMPVALYALITSIVGDDDVFGLPFAVFYAASMVAYGAGVAVFLNLPEAVMVARDRGILKRLRGTPLQTWQYLAGRTLAGLWVAFVIAVSVLAVGIALYGVTLTVAGVLVGLVGLLAVTLTMTACGFAVASQLSNAKAVSAVALVVLLPLSFFSDIFFVGIPNWMRTVGSLFPLLHAQRVPAAAWNPGGAEIAWRSFGVLLLWFVGAGAVAVRYFRWESRAS
jgi:ABC-type multidrug transport system permease subunit